MDYDLDYWRPRFLTLFPELVEGQTFEYTSDPDLNYNCLAWALSINTAWFEKAIGCFWPWDNIPDDSPDGWVKVCELHGFAVQNDLDLSFVKGVEKIAIMVDEDGELHATRQSKEGKWKSKVGAGPDIDHNDIECIKTSYGEVVRVVQRTRADWIEA